ncbi:MAG: NAD(P)H-quinone oxidoreductase [Deltaproteobacteria bacterium]|nr:NAD(P)H-quinone oxidoreductase [Deltaproteobacteria bacterium]
MSIEARCVRIRESGGPEVLELSTTEVRDPGPGEVRVAVAAAGLNRADTLQRRGFYPAPKGFPDDIPGLELAGTVESLGEGVSGFAVGDPVMAIIGGGGMATHAVVHSRELLPVPTGLSLEEAAAIPEVFLTAFDALFAQGDLRMGETVVLHAVASGVGTAALQLAANAGARVIGTSRSADKLERCKELGLAHAVDTSDGTFADPVQQLGGADLIVDTIGAKYLAENLKALALRGRVVVLGLMGGVKGEMPLGLLLGKRARITGSTLRARPLEEKAALAQRFIREALPHFADGRLKPVIDAILPMSEVGEAHARMERNETFGKLVLSWK